MAKREIRPTSDEKALAKVLWHRDAKINHFPRSWWKAGEDDYNAMARDAITWFDKHFCQKRCSIKDNNP